MNTQHLLPPNGTAFERTVSQALVPEARGLAVIDKAQRPFDIPEHILPYLAWSWDIPPVWPKFDNQRRALVAESLTLHKTRGTAYCLKRLAKLAGAEIVHLHTPPGKLFAGKSLSADERTAFAAVHPEIRWYPYQKMGYRVGLFTGDCLHNAFCVRSDAMQRLADRVELHDPLSGMIKVLDHQMIARAAVERLQPDAVTVRLPSTAKGLFVGKSLTGFIVNHNAAARYYTLDLSLPVASTFNQYASLSLSPGLSPLTGAYEPIRTAGSAQNRLFTTRSLGSKTAFVGHCAVASSAGLRFGRALRLFDPIRVRLQPRNATVFAGAVRLTRTHHHNAYAHIDLTHTTDKFKAFTGVMGKRYLQVSTAFQRITNVRQLLAWGLKAADRLWLRTDSYQMITASQILPAGTATAGEYRINTI